MNASQADALQGRSDAIGNRSIAAHNPLFLLRAGLAVCLHVAVYLTALSVFSTGICIAAPPATGDEHRNATPQPRDDKQAGNVIQRNGIQRGNQGRPTQNEIRQASGERRMPGVERADESTSARTAERNENVESNETADEAPATTSNQSTSSHEQTYKTETGGDSESERLFSDERPDNSNAAAATTGDDFQKPRMLPERDSAKRPGSSSTGSRPSTGNTLWSAAGWLSIIVAALLVSGRFLLRAVPNVTGFLPPEAIQVLGRRTLAPRFSLHLVRCGRRILIIGSHPHGLTSLGEVTDPAEVDHLAGLCTPSASSSPAQTFAALFSRFSTSTAPANGTSPVDQTDDNPTHTSDLDRFTVNHDDEPNETFAAEPANNPLRPFPDITAADQLRDRLQQRLAADALSNDDTATSSNGVSNYRARSRQEPRSA